MKINIKTNGNNSNAQDTPGNPALQIKFKTQVQNNTYMNLTTKTKKILGT